MGHWGWYIINYLFLGGLGAGAYLTSFAAEKGWFGKATNLKRAGYFLAGPSVAVGIFLFAMNLGVTFKGLLTMVANPRSVMSWGIYILTAFTIVGFVCAFYTRQNRKIPALLSFLGALLALAAGIYTGALLSGIFAVPFWNTLLVPVLFVVSAFSIGLASASLLARFTEKCPVIESARVNRIQVVLVAAELILIGLLLSITISGRNGVVAASSARTIVTGSLAVPFWSLLVALGLVVPFLYYLSQSTKREDRNRKWLAATLSDVAVLIGGITLRAVVVLSVVPIWNGLTN